MRTCTFGKTQLYQAVFSITLCFLTGANAPAQDCLKGDVNLDGIINFADVLPFQDVILNGPHQCEADANYCGLVDLLDVQPMLKILLNQQDADFQNSSAAGPGDFFWSTQALNEGASNEVIDLEMTVGETVTLFLYYSMESGNAGELNVGAALNVGVSQPGIVSFIDANSMNFHVAFAGTPLFRRWQFPDEQGHDVVVQPAMSVKEDLIIGITAGGSLVSSGMNQQNVGNPFLDEGYDIGANAFLFGSIRFTAVAPGTVSLTAGPNDLGIAHNYDLLDVTIAAANITVGNPVLLGDVNLDTYVDLLDVPFFVDRLESGEFQAEADCNEDGAVNLLDVSYFVDILAGG